MHENILNYSIVVYQSFQRKFRYQYYLVCIETENIERNQASWLYSKRSFGAADLFIGFSQFLHWGSLVLLNLKPDTFM